MQAVVAQKHVMVRFDCNLAQQLLLNALIRRVILKLTALPR